MARWRLTAAHYLNVPGTEWEQKETDQQTGRQARKVYIVPRLVDPKDPGDCNRDGDAIVCDGNNPQPRDVIFTGPPTPDMEPLDAEAEAITERERPKWIHPIESLGGTYSDSVLADLTKQLASIASGQAGPVAAPVSAGSVSKADFDALQAQVGALMAKNAELEAKQPQPIARRA